MRFIRRVALALLESLVMALTVAIALLKIMEIQNENPNFNHGSSVIAVVPNSSVLARPSEEQGEISALRLYYRTKSLRLFS
ncbi:hypothetical protein [Succinivibrio dextrinosolvens]|uniref:hypothetical protein n=1 Tax=Succinivibrio dextrinosolvens TaxID=83771 RepID=UPI00241EA6A7|nr:hypothetical protein [Succinivibrio dextrinosolvens]MBE6422575.1 hypothetical protein [Succinivibrio dextrinosolvens]